MKIIFITDAILFTILLAGCASEQVNISSMPPGALVSIDGRRVGVTPFTAEFISHRTYSVKAVKDGYMAVEMKSCPVDNDLGQKSEIARAMEASVLAAAGIFSTYTNAPRHEPVVFVLQPLSNTK